MRSEAGESVRVVQEAVFHTRHRLNSFPRPLRSGVVDVTGPDHQVPAREAPESSRAAFNYTLSGEGICRVHGSEHRVPEETGFVYETADPEVVYYLPEGAALPWRFLFLEFAGASDLVREMELRFGHIYTWPRDSRLIQRVLKYVERESNRVDISNREGSALVIEVLGTLVDSADPAQSMADQRGLVERAKEEIQADLDRNGTQLANLLGVSREYLCRQFKKVTGTTLHRYISTQRVHTGRLLLGRTSLSCTEIASRVGFRGESHFAKVFRAHTGVSPTQFRKAD